MQLNDKPSATRAFKWTYLPHSSCSFITSDTPLLALHRSASKDLLTYCVSVCKVLKLTGWLQHYRGLDKRWVEWRELRFWMRLIKFTLISDDWIPLAGCERSIVIGKPDGHRPDLLIYSRSFQSTFYAECFLFYCVYPTFLDMLPTEKGSPNQK